MERGEAKALKQKEGGSNFKLQVAYSNPQHFIKKSTKKEKADDN